LQENPEIFAHKLPMVINTEIYSDIIKNKGPLTPEEVQKTNKYFDYYSHSDLDATKTCVTKEQTKKYRENPLEIEAYEAQRVFIKTGKVI